MLNLNESTVHGFGHHPTFLPPFNGFQINRPPESHNQSNITFDWSYYFFLETFLKMSDLSDPNRLSIVLTMLSANDTSTVRKGEKLLKPFLKHATCISHILNQIKNSPDISIRHHASLLLKKKLGGFYTKFNTQHQNELKGQLLATMVTEPNKAVGTAIAGAVAIVAKSVFAKNETWPELFNLLMQLSQDPSEALRTLNYRLLAQVCKHIHHTFLRHESYCYNLVFTAGRAGGDEPETPHQYSGADVRDGLPGPRVRRGDRPHVRHCGLHHGARQRGGDHGPKGGDQPNVARDEHVSAERRRRDGVRGPGRDPGVLQPRAAARQRPHRGEPHRTRPCTLWLC